jgi:hypothetical protein
MKTGSVTRTSIAAHFTRGTLHAIKIAATTLSAGAAAISILSFVHVHGLPWEPKPANASDAMPPVAWLGVSPGADTVYSIGDTVQLAATLKDGHGILITGGDLSWSSDDSDVATVDQAGAVVARGEGAATIVIAAGGKVGRSRILVNPRVASVEIVFDSTFKIPEQDTRPAAARALDARGHWLSGHPVEWRSSDTAVATVDSAGTVHGLTPGRTMLAATIEGSSARVELEVVPVPGSMSAVGGLNQRGDPGVLLPQPIVIQVLSRGGRPVEGVPVRFATEAGSGGTTAQTDLTDAQGRARASWTLGAVPGGERLNVSVPGVDSVLVVRAEADPLAANTRMVLVTEPPSGAAGDSLKAPVTVRVTDTLGTALSDLPVAWSALDGGKLVALSARTDSLGETRAAWRLGQRAGPQRARLQVGNPKRLPAFTVSTLAKAGSPSRISVVSGNGQTGPVGAALGKAIVVAVTDRHGNRVAGAEVRIRPEVGTVPDSGLTSDSTGVVLTRWTLGRTAGGQRLQARAEGVDSAVSISAEGSPLAPSSVRFAAAPTEGSAGRALAQPVRAVLRDAYGNPLAGRSVNFSATAGKLAPSSTKTDAKGVALTHWTLGPKTGTQVLTVSVKGAPPRDTLAVKAAKTVGQ